MTVLSTDRLTLRPMTAADYPDVLHVWTQDPGLYGPLTGKPMTGEDVWMRLLRDVGHWATLGHGNWAMRLDDGRYVGSVGVLDYRRTMTPLLDAPELGWGLASAFHGQGLASEGLAAALKWTDQVMKAPRTVCIISPDNAPSLKLAARAGYVPHVQGVFRDAPINVLERVAPH